MAGGSEEHSALAVEVLGALRDAATVLLEVTRDSSEEYDTRDKVEYYRTVPSLRDYVVVSHRGRRITVHSRSAEGEWTTRVSIAGGRASPSRAGKTELSVDDIYNKSSIR